MGKKLLCLIMAVCFVLGLTACGNNSVAMDNSAKNDATLHGGFVAETDDYVYFINGVESYVTEYKTGDVTKAALLRTKKSNLAKLDSLTASDYDTIVSKLIVSDDVNAGIYVYGDYVYYAVPSNENDKTGHVKSDQLNFFRTKLDGTHTSKNITGRDFTHSAKFRYVQSGNNVYLVVYSTELYIYDAVEGKELYTTENDDVLTKVSISELLFSEDSTNLYFTSYPVNKVLSDKDNVQKDSHHVVYQVSLSSAAAKVDTAIVLDGVGKKNVGNEEGAEEGVDLVGVTVDLIKNVGGKLYFSYTSLNTTSGTKPIYMAIAESELTEANAKAWKTDANTLTFTTANTSSIFADSSLFHNGKIYYVNATHGLMVYDAAKADDATTVDGISRVYYSDTVKGATLDFIVSEGEEEVIYFHDASSNYYKLSLTNPEEELRLNTHAINTAWYKPEVVALNGEYYLIAVYTDSEFKSYCYAINTTKLAAAYAELTEDEDKTAFYEVAEEDEEESEEEEVVIRATDFSNLIGVLKDSDVEEESAE